MSIQLIRGLVNIRPQHQGCAISIGNFDGVHKGHQALLAQLQEYAKIHALKTMVMIFEPQPGEYFARGKYSPVARLMRFREKVFALNQAGVDYICCLPFNAALSKLSPEEFIHEILLDTFQVKHIIIGEDFRFGSGQQGDVALLQAIGQQQGFSVYVMPDFVNQDKRVSSTQIRAALKAADHRLAEELLGHPYYMIGKVVPGNKQGRVLGFPTANINVHRAVTPVAGIYNVRMYGVSDKGLPGVANVGTRPAIGGTRTLLEVHLFNFHQDIYGRYVRVEFCHKQRDEKYYPSMELLRQQILLDAEAARHYFIATGEM